jgi:predicted lipoprotein with Yx(FWY)xxD motif
MRLVNRPAVLVFVGALFAGCAGGGGSVSMKAPAMMPQFAVPASIARAVPAPPPAFTPAQPSGDRGTSTTRRGTRAAHASFFAGEAALSNGVYYLALPNGNPFGYYSYLPDQNYIYHFDAGYEYVFDANDGGGVYLYDFTSGHWWYTGRTYPFPYVYDFSLGAFLYYYPNTSSAGHYTTNSRYFYNFTAAAIISLPDPNGTAPLTESVAGAMAFVHPESHKTLYYLDVDTATGATCTAGCLAAWPALAPTAGAQTTADMTMATRSDGTGQQWDYQGHPLYNYVGDSAPREVNGDNIPDFGGHWHVARPASAATVPPTPTDPPSKCPGGYC